MKVDTTRERLPDRSLIQEGNRRVPMLFLGEFKIASNCLLSCPGKWHGHEECAVFLSERNNLFIDLLQKECKYFFRLAFSFMGTVPMRAEPVKSLSIPFGLICWGVGLYGE